MTTALIYRGRGKNLSALDQAALRLQVTLHSLGFEAHVVAQEQSLATVTDEVQARARNTQAQLVFVVGYSAAFAVAQQWNRQLPLVAVLPDIPSHTESLYDSTSQNIETIIRLADYTLVNDTASRSLIEYSVPGADGSVGTLARLEPVLRMLKLQDMSFPPLKVLISSHDFRFTPGIVRMLEKANNVEVKLEEWALEDSAPTDPNHQELMDWADVVLCEWAGRNAIWYSHNLPTGKRLLIRLHGFEAKAAWITDLNFSRVDQLILVSEFYREQVLSMHRWDPHKIKVIGNSIEFDAFTRPKHEDAPYHLGMLGITPFLKRPDQAVDVLENLLAHDERYMLHLRGRAPWRFSWLWNNNLAEVDAYRQLYQRIGSSAQLREHVVFEAQGANVESWFSKIGWVLSLSERETFHLAAAEGMASGAVPLFVERTGVTDIFSDRWVFPSAEAIADYVLEHTSRPLWSAESAAAQSYATRFDFQEVAQEWANSVCGVEGA